MRIEHYVTRWTLRNSEQECHVIHCWMNIVGWNFKQKCYALLNETPNKNVMSYFGNLKKSTLQNGECCNLEFWQFDAILIHSISLQQTLYNLSTQFIIEQAPEIWTFRLHSFHSSAISLSQTSLYCNLSFTSLWQTSYHFDKHISNVCSSCWFHTRVILHIRSFLDLATFKTIACAIVGSRLDYLYIYICKTSRYMK